MNANRTVYKACPTECSKEPSMKSAQQEPWSFFRNLNPGHTILLINNFERVNYGPTDEPEIRLAVTWAQQRVFRDDKHESSVFITEKISDE